MVQVEAELIYFFGNGDGNYDVDLAYPGTDNGAWFGYSVSSAGDWNNDGYSDVLVGAPESSINGGASTNRGRVFIFYGNGDGVADAQLAYPGIDNSTSFGSSVASAGDFNGDGYSDVVVGAYESDLGGIQSGRALIFYGNGDGNADIQLATVIQTGNTDFGTSVSSAGDVNGDGYSDVIVGAPRSDVGGQQRGRAEIFYGGSQPDGIADIDLPYPDTFSLTYFGIVVSSSDVNNDGYSDVLVGSSSSKLYISLGGASPSNPVFNFFQKAPATCSMATNLEATWRGKSTTAATSSNILLQIYRFGSTNAWETVTTDSSLAANTLGYITGNRTSNITEYCDGSNWTYWRVYQASGNMQFESDYFSMIAPETKIKGGSLFKGGSLIK